MLKPDVKQTEPCDLRGGIQSYCQRHFGDPQAVQGLATEMQKYRDRIRDIRTSDVHLESARANLTSYIGFINLVERRFPIATALDGGEDVGGSSASTTSGTTTRGVSVNLTWYDTFRPKIKTQKSSFALERAACIYNIAALEGSAAVNTNRNSEEGSRMATQLFCKSAGVFAYLRDHVAEELAGVATHDLSQGALHLWCCTMIAQANTCVYEKGVKEKKMRSLLAKLAMRVAMDYASCLAAAKKLSGAIGPQFAEIFAAQEKTFLAAATFQKAMAEKVESEKTMKGWGECLARFRYALGLCEEAKKSQYADVNALRDAVFVEFEKVRKDCENIYFPTEPAASALVPIVAIDVSKPTPVGTKAGVVLSGGARPFASLGDLVDEAAANQFAPAMSALLPRQVSVALQDYQMRQESVLFALDDDWKQARVEVEGALNEHNLPYAVLETGEHGGKKIPDSVWMNLQEASGKGGLAALTASIEALHEYDKVVGTLLDDCFVKLEEEKEEDLECKARFGATQWKRESSETLQESFRGNLLSYKTKLAEARSANELLKGRFSNLKMNPNMQWIGKSRDQIENSLPAELQPSAQQLSASSAGSAGGLTSGEQSDRDSKFAPVREALRKLEAAQQNVAAKFEMAKQTIKAETGNVEAELLSAANSDLANAGPACRKIVEGRIDAHSALRENSELVAGRAQLKKDAEQVVVLYQACLEASRAAPPSERQQIIAALDNAATTLQTALRDTADGINFYTRLGDFLRQCKQQISDFCMARSDEKAQLLDNIGQNAGARGGGMPIMGAAGMTPPPSSSGAANMKIHTPGSTQNNMSMHTPGPTAANQNMQHTPGSSTTAANQMEVSPRGVPGNFGGGHQMMHSQPVQSQMQQEQHSGFSMNFGMNNANPQTGPHFANMNPSMGGGPAPTGLQQSSSNFPPQQNTNHSMPGMQQQQQVRQPQQPQPNEMFAPNHSSNQLPMQQQVGMLQLQPGGFGAPPQPQFGGPPQQQQQQFGLGGSANANFGGAAPPGPSFVPQHQQYNQQPQQFQHQQPQAAPGGGQMFPGGNMMMQQPQQQHHQMMGGPGQGYQQLGTPVNQNQMHQMGMPGNPNQFAHGQPGGGNYMR